MTECKVINESQCTDCQFLRVVLRKNSETKYCRRALCDNLLQANEQNEATSENRTQKPRNSKIS